LNSARGFEISNAFADANEGAQVKTADAISSTAAIAQRIAEVRKERGISQQAMAKKLGVTQPIISRYERGELRIHAELLAKIAKILATTSDSCLLKRPSPRTNSIHQRSGSFGRSSNRSPSGLRRISEQSSESSTRCPSDSQMEAAFAGA